MRLLNSPRGTPYQPSAEHTEFQVRAGFGPGRRYWTLNGLLEIRADTLTLVVPEDSAGPARVVVEAPVAGVKVLSKPWWSFGAGVYLEIAGERYTVEPEPFYPTATPSGIKRARHATRAFTDALDAAQRGG